MSRFLYVTDLHLQSRAPGRRVDEWPAAALDKVRWIQAEADREGCRAILCGGDLFETPRPALSLVSELLGIVGSGSVPWWLVVGNHDEVGHNLDTWRTGALGVLDRTPWFDVLPDMDEEGPVALEDVELRVWHYRHGIDSRSDYEIKRTVAVQRDRPIIAMAHAMVVPEPAHFESVAVRDVRIEADLFLGSHYHPAWGPVEANGTVFLSPGALLRGTIETSSLGRRPKVLLIEAAAGRLSVEERIVPHRPTEEVFDLEGAARERAWDSRISSFMDKMTTVKVRGLDLRSRIERAAKDLEAERDVVDLAVERVSEEEVAF